MHELVYSFDVRFDDLLIRINPCMHAIMMLSCKRIYLYMCMHVTYSNIATACPIFKFIAGCRTCMHGVLQTLQHLCCICKALIEMNFGGMIVRQ